ncbi:Nif3-like dinuclear metal center hexameric protein [Williamsoniiplasma somnilux]|uniref:GTP cyclohydrolase 1 type 2 homolog n=1 Tax=Williamsoniiplasma somnilux TaxID=215578 RepID=A0A2K8NY78_9MOLU|nr:Nif3-like dinuclear metal center hexameric protein [Williamsoniiplasma somnilux]ATZ18785.1 Nif3-like dinuclear metal center hexameric protein [Williamsoniiplasma somnilux]
MELIKIIKYLDKKFDPNLAYEWDFNGIQNISNKQNIDFNTEITNVVIALDLNKNVVEFAIANNVNLIITRHPFIFGELVVEKQNPQKSKMIKLLINHNLVIYSIHTNYDASIYQNIQNIVSEQFNIKKFSHLKKNKECIKFILKNKITHKEFRETFKKIFSLEHCQINKSWDDHKQLNEFYLTSGSGASTMIEQKMEQKIFVTGEVKWNEWIYAEDNEVSLLALGHYMENYFIYDIKNKLINTFKDLKITTIDIENQFRKG